ncbi:hypothetical protein MHU86_24512 [Fragilaria crotonensis]|nr:hypothetical protein MHU86_24512 [Fragilaria crotonensis]
MNATQSSSILTIALRVQADRAPLVSNRDWETAIALANIEVYKRVNAVLVTFFGTTRDVKVDTTLTIECEPGLCVEIKTDVTLFPSLEPVMERLVMGALRQAVYDMKREYGDLGLSVAWLAPNISATLIGWHMDGLLSTVSSEEERIFCTEARNFLTNAILDVDHTCDTVLFLNQFTTEHSRLEIHSALLGTSARENTHSYRKMALQVFNNATSTGFLHQLSSSPMCLNRYTVWKHLHLMTRISSRLESLQPRLRLTTAIQPLMTGSRSQSTPRILGLHWQCWQSPFRFALRL